MKNSPILRRDLCISGCVLILVLVLTLGIVVLQRKEPQAVTDDTVNIAKVSTRDTDSTEMPDESCESSHIDSSDRQSTDITMPADTVYSGDITSEDADTAETDSAPAYTQTDVPHDSVTAAQTQVSPSQVTEYGKTSKGFEIKQIDGVTYVDGLLVVNKTYPLPESYNPGGLTPEAYGAFARMQSDAAAQGIYLVCISGFRSFADQRYTYNAYAARDGVDAADTYSARPGHSEHQSGLALDVNSLYFSFADTAEGKWLLANCARYGFIIRYPKDKTDSTGYVYEPWHIRYVGKERAAAITESGLTLEEYYGITSTYGD